MAQKWKMKIWGVRGSMPAASRSCLGYGGNTSCISIDCGEDIVVFDAGSGLTAMGGSLTERKPLHLFIGHIHIDHIMGLFQFPPFYDPGAEVHLYGEPRDGMSFRQSLEKLIGPPYWPVGFANFQAHVVFHETGPGQQIHLPGGRTVRTLRGNHPNMGLIHRLESGGRSIVYTLDCELTDALRPALVEFCRDTDVLIWDGNFTNDDLAAHPGWGHSSWEQGVEIGREAGAKTVLMTHFSQNYTDTFLQEQERQAIQACGTVRFAKEGMEVDL